MKRRIALGGTGTVRGRNKGRWIILLGALAAACGDSPGGGQGATPTVGQTLTPERTATTAPSTRTPTEAGAFTTATNTAPPQTSVSSTPTPTASPAITVAPATATGTIPSGPIVTYLGLVRPDGCQTGCFGTVCFCRVTPTPEIDAHGRVVYEARGGGRGLLVVEGMPGASGLPPGILLVVEDPDERPDLQIQSSRSMGDGSTDVCDHGPPPEGGGIPGIDPPDFGPGQHVTDALRDFACRFAVQPESREACTLDNLGDFAFRDGRSTIQYCSQTASVAAFPHGKTVVTARLRDVGGNLGPAAQIVVNNETED